MNVVPLMLLLGAASESRESPGFHDSLVVLLLVGLLVVVIAVAALAVLVISRTQARNGDGRQVASGKERNTVTGGPWHLPQRWLAIKSDSARAVQDALRIDNPVVCSWLEGFTPDSRQKLFISAPVNGWVLVIGSDLPDPAHDIDECFHFIRATSAKLGCAQFFCANSVIYSHAWVKAYQGQIIRAYAWSGQTLWNHGPLTSPERDLRVECYDYGEQPKGVLIPEACRTNTEKVFDLAGRWSVNPAALDLRAMLAEGIAGQLSAWRLK